MKDSNLKLPEEFFFHFNERLFGLHRHVRAFLQCCLASDVLYYTAKNTDHNIVKLFHNNTFSHKCGLGLRPMHFGPQRFAVRNKSCRVVSNVSKDVKLVRLSLSNSLVLTLHVFSF